jgi:hypothetical protein
MFLVYFPPAMGGLGFEPGRITTVTIGCVFLATVLSAGGCAAPTSKGAPPPQQRIASGVEASTKDISLTILRVAAPGDAASLLQGEGWNEYQLALKNRSSGPLMIHDVRLLTAQGRYIESAGNYADIVAPPDTEDKISEEVARRSAGIAAGQVVPFGGTLVGLFSSAASSYSAQERAKAQRTFALRRIKNVELAAGGRVRGSAFLPEIPDGRYLVVEYSARGRSGQVRVPLR